MYQELTSDIYRLALGYARPVSRQVYAALFDLEMQLARMVCSNGEPMLRQIKLAWWREQLDTLGETSHSNPLLRSLASHWRTQRSSLVEMVDGWETLLMQAGERDLELCIRRRSAGYEAAAKLLDAPVADADIAVTIRWWLAADLLGCPTEGSERAILLRLAQSWPGALPRLPAALRPFSVLASLGQRAVLRGGAPPLSHRTDALAAARVGLLGR